jgi:hypothetical protein
LNLGRRPPLYPLALAAAFVIQFFGTTSAPADWLWRPLAVGMALTAVIYVASWLAVRRAHLAALVTAGIVLALLDAVLLAVLLLAGAALLYLVKRMWPVMPVPSLRNFSGAADVAAAVMLVLVVWEAAPEMAPDPEPTTAAVAFDASLPKPNIYIILLDGYARADTLARFGLDNTPFLDQLQDRGFVVASHATSSYRITKTTMVSMLHMAHLSDMDFERPADRVDEARLLRHMVNDSPAIATLEALGYHIVSIPPGVAMVDVRNVDEVIQHGFINELEEALRERTLLDDVVATIAPTLFMDLWRDRINASFADIRMVAERQTATPTVMYAHVMAPHAPFAFDADGGPATSGCYPDHCVWFAGTMPGLGLDKATITARYTAQVQAINVKAIDTLDAIIDADPGAVIVVFGDHGSRVDPDDLDEWYHPLFASRTPGRTIYGDQVGATQVFAGLLAGYFGADVTVPRVERFVELRPLTTEPYVPATDAP